MRKPSSLLAAGFFIALVSSSACGGSLVNTDAGSNADAAGNPDGATANDAAVEGSPPFPDAGAFCSGTSPRLMINGSEVAVANVSGKAIVLNCCDSAELFVASAAFQAVFALLWRAPAPSGTSIDLGSPPTGFQIELDLGCDPATTNCATSSPEERYASGFQGTLQYAYSSSGLTASYCLSVAESPQSPHTLIHSLQLYAPNVISN